MKKELIITILFSLFFAFNSCDKDNSVIENAQTKDIAKISASVENNMLVFKTQEDYEQMLLNWSNVAFESILGLEEEMGFHSMYAEHKKNNTLESLPCDDPFLPLILNPESKIKIGVYEFMLDFKNEKVVAINSDNKSYQDFNFGDDVIPYLFEDVELDKNDYCNGRREQVFVGPYQKEGWVRYYNAGIYHSLYSQFHNYNEPARMETLENYSWRNNNESDGGSFNLSGSESD